MTTATEKIDYASPNKLLKGIGKYLNQNGGLSCEAVENLVEFMKESKNYLVPKCIVLTIISMSSCDVQTKLCESGAWNILFQWLQEGLKNDTTCFIVDILKLYLKLPINFSHLKSNACPKLIKKLAKTGNEEITPIANDIYNKWKQLVQENTKKDVVPAKKPKLEEKPDNIVITEAKKKLSTVKVKNTSFRTAGVEDESEKSKKNESKLDKSSVPTIDEMHQKVDKRKVIELHESKNFMNSIMQSSAPPKKKKKPKAINNSVNKSNDDIPKADTSINENVMDTSVPEVMTEKPKKKVSWAPTESIETVHYFELDENERVNVNRVSIEEMRKKEKLMEKQTVSKKYVADDEEDFIEKWSKPSMITTPSDITVESAEKKIQQDRERKVLKIFYFQKEAIPSTPNEPDSESYDVKEPKIIPLTEVITTPKPKTSPTQVINNQPSASTSKDNKLIIITDKDGTEPKASLRPDVVNLLKYMTQNSSTSNSTVPTGNNVVHEPEDPARSNTNDPALKSKLINFIRQRYPDVEPENLSCEELYNLLVPMRDQLIREGINLPDNFQKNTSLFYQPPPPPNVGPSHFVAPPPPHPSQWYPGPEHMPSVRPPRYYPPAVGPPHHMGHMVHRPSHHRGQYHHGPRPHPPGPRSQVCRFFANTGYCRQGQNCSFSHSIPPDFKRH